MGSVPEGREFVRRAAMSCLREEDDPYVIEEPSDEEQAQSRWERAAAGVQLSRGVGG